MNLRKMKNFFTLTRKASGGFTLVELIVVIAILAILAGVAVPAYSGYVKKANMQADMTLVSDVAHALQLAYYGDINSATSDYVILKTTGASTEEDGFADAAMTAAFGEGWADSLSLSYDGWTDDGLLNYVLNNADSAELIANSTFLTTASPDSLMYAVTNLTDAATGVIQNYADKGGDVESKLKMIVGEEFVTSLQNTGVTASDDEYETVISNMLVGHFAETLSNSQVEDALNDDIVGMMLVYAEVYAYCETIGDNTTMAALNTYLAETDDMDKLTVTGLSTYLSTVAPDGFMEGFASFEGQDLEDPTEGQGYKDIEAALEIMGAVDYIAGTYTDAASLSNPDLYSSDSVAEQLNNYISAIKATAKMDSDTLATLATLGENDIVIFVSEDGAISVVPGAAYLASRG